MDDVFDQIFEELPIYSNEALKLLGDAVQRELKGRRNQAEQIEKCDKCGFRGGCMSYLDFLLWHIKPARCRMGA